MAISFKKLRDPKLQLTDKITFGKLAGCRVCDVIEDHYEYLIWASKSGLVVYSTPVVERLLELGGFHEKLRYYREEVVPWIKDDWDEVDSDIQLGDLPDVPF